MSKRIGVGPNVHWARIVAFAASGRAMTARPGEFGNIQHGHERKQRTKRAEKLAEESFAHDHANNNSREQAERNPAYALDRARENPCEGHPRTKARIRAPNTEKARNANTCQHNVLDQRKNPDEERGKLGPGYRRFRPNSLEYRVQNIPKRPESAGISAEEASEHDREHEHCHKKRHERSRLQRLNGSKLREQVLNPAKRPREHSRR